MAKKVEKPKILPVNKTVVFWSPLEGDNVLVRTGVIPDADSFIHSVLHSYSTEYVDSSNDDRQIITHKLKKNIIKNISKEVWCGMPQNVRKYRDNLLSLYENFYKFMDNKPYRGKTCQSFIRQLIKKEKDPKYETYKFVCSILTYYKLEEMVKDITTISGGPTFLKNSCKEYIYGKKEFKKANVEKVKVIIDLIYTFIDKSCESVYNQTYIDYINNFGNDVDQNVLKLLSDKFKRDIYIIDSNNRLPSGINNPSELKGRKSMILLSINNHYEIIGKLLPDNEVIREFAPDDDLVEKLYFYCTSPEDVCIEYPELKEYLPRGMVYVESDVSSNYESSREEDSDEYFSNIQKTYQRSRSRSR